MKNICSIFTPSGVHADRVETENCVYTINVYDPHADEAAQLKDEDFNSFITSAEESIERWK